MHNTNTDPIQTPRSGKKAKADPHTPSVEDAQYFFKVAWPEISRRKESLIIQTALERAEKLLPVEHQAAVMEHMPNVIQSQEVEGTSTAIVRRLLGLPVTGSRVQHWMISRKLSKLETIVGEPEAFWKAYWEIIRCMSLLPE